MAKTITKKMRKPLSPKPAAKRADTAYPVEREDLDEQQERLSKADAAGAGALKATAPPAPAEAASAPATVPSKPLAPLAALWPDPIPSKGKPGASPGPAPQIQKAPVTAIAPKPAAATAAPLPPPPVQSPPPKSPERAAVTAPAIMPAAPKTLGVRFALHKPEAKGVSVCGDFNGWSPSATPMKGNNHGGWETTVALAPGRYQYKFLVDGEWLLDPAARKTVLNEYGSLNSVVEVRA